MLKKLLGSGLSIVLASSLYANTTSKNITVNNIYLNKVIINLEDSSQKVSFQNILDNSTQEEKAQLEQMAYSFYTDMQSFKSSKDFEKDFEKDYANVVFKSIYEFKEFINTKQTKDRKLASTMLTLPKKYVPKFSYKDFTQGMDFGTALNTLTGETQTAHLCLTDLKVADPIFRGEKYYKLEVINSLDSLRDTFHFDGSVSFDNGQISGNLKGAYDHYEDVINDSLLVRLAVEYQQYDFRLDSPKLSPDMELIYEDGNSYERFREKCGDRYLSTITTGGRYVGILEITTNGTEEKEEIAAHLDGKYNGGAITGEIEANLATALSEISKEYNTKIEIISKGGLTENKLIQTVDEFYESANKFLSTFDNEDLGSDYKKSAYLTKFDPYDPITTKVKGGAIAVQMEVMNDYINYSNMYDTYLNELSYIKSNMEKYTNAEEKDSEMEALRLELLMKKAEIRNLVTKCQRKDPLTRECILIEDLDNADTFKNEWDLGPLLPTKKILYPRTCSDRQDIYPGSSSEDKEYRLYMGADKFKPFSIYCDQMYSETPTEYMTLKNISPITDHPSFNYTKYSGFLDKDSQVDFGDEETTDTNNSEITLPNIVDLITIYNKLKVKISYDHIAVSDTQDKFFETIGDTVYDNEDNQYSKALYANPRNLSANSIGMANINTAGTGFEISTNTNFVNISANSEFSEFEYINTPKNWQEAKIHAKSIGAELVSIETAEENLKLIEFIKSKSISTPIWIGANDINFEGQFDWSNGSNFIYSNWAANNPHNSTDLNCVQMTTNPNEGYKWSDKSCDEEKTFIVQYSTATQTNTIINNTREDAVITTTGKDGNARSEYDLILDYVK